ncbi:purine-nucleoside phosphorylase [Blattabacterium cuenoti]|uniref:purine-nucleoside phosphorylase n=1 Tax=Blattabacterium cuenoti TaxID=1653831 RepID=UPI00163C1D37|nr:purine-nucleoside phosphorylase [Blattabacterium cuenoti]
MSMNMILEKSKKYIQNKIKEKPDFGILLLENQFDKLIEEIQNPICIFYEEIPIFSKKKLYGKFLFGKIEGKNVVFLIEHFSEKKDNRINYFTIILCKNIGIDKLILINISGGVNPNYKMGDVMLIKDHINLFPEIPNDFLKNRFFEITKPYDQNMLEIAENIAMNHNIIIQKGVYVAFPYFYYKTYAEYAMIQSIGGDSVGRNIVKDVITARCMNLRVFAISIIVMGLSKYNIQNHEDYKNTFFHENKKSISLLILIIKDFIKLCL